MRAPTSTCLKHTSEVAVATDGEDLHWFEPAEAVQRGFQDAMDMINLHMLSVWFRLQATPDEETEKIKKLEDS